MVYTSDMKDMINDKGGELTSDKKKKLEDAIKNAIQWLNNNERCDIEAINQKMKQIENVCHSIINKRHK